MAWGNGTGPITVTKSASKQCIAQKEVNYDSGEDTAPRIKVHGIFLVFVKATQTVTTKRGLSKEAAESLVNAADATASQWNAAWAAVNGEKLGAVELLTKLNEIGARNGVGVVDICENRLVGMKSRGVYENPGGALLYYAHRELEYLCLDWE